MALSLRNKLVLGAMTSTLIGMLFLYGILSWLLDSNSNALSPSSELAPAQVASQPQQIPEPLAPSLPSSPANNRPSDSPVERPVESPVQETPNSGDASVSGDLADIKPLTPLEQLNRYFVLALIVSLLLAYGLSHFLTRHLGRSLQALELGLLNFKDNDFSINIPVEGDSQLRALGELFNDSASELRRERQYIYQRELLLDKVIQSSPNIMLLLDDNQRILYANDAARHMFNQGVKLDGLLLPSLFDELPLGLVQALKQPKDGLFSLGEEEVETWHLSRGRFLLNGQFHHLLLLKQMTRELNRQEVAVWKKVIRIISHELNNSVAPISSMVNSGRMLTQDLQDPKLTMIFDTIEDRTRHLSQFIVDYARFAKLPQPNKIEVNWHKLTEQLAQHYSFTLIGELPKAQGFFDLTQMEQVLINLLKNAHESGSDACDISLSISQTYSPVEGRNQLMLNRDDLGHSIQISDGGSGMSPEVLEQALLPFYSTKQSGTGLGLPLCREIIEAHDGCISLHNRQEGGLTVSLWLPMK